MSDLVPFFDEDEQLDDNLLRSIETLLDDEQNSGELNRRKISAEESRMTRSAPSSPVPQFEQMNGTTFAFGNQIYQKWSTNESTETQTLGQRRNFARNQFRTSSLGKSMRKVPPPPPPPTPQPVRINAQYNLAQYKAMLDEKANQLLNQYLRLNYASVSAQAQKLGVPVDQYIRNLMVALNSQTFMNNMMMPNQPLLFPPMSPVQQQPMTMPTVVQQRAFAKQYFNKKN